MHSYGHARNRRKSQKITKNRVFCDYDHLWGSVASTPLLCWSLNLAWLFLGTRAICILKIGKIGFKRRALVCVLSLHVRNVEFCVSVLTVELLLTCYNTSCNSAIRSYLRRLDMNTNGSFIYKACN